MATPDWSRSPGTGWTRDHWIELLARLTAAFAVAARDGGSPARPRLPGAAEATVVEGLEAFARMSVAWGAWLGLPANGTWLGHDGEIVDVEHLVVRGLLDGTEPGGRWAWGGIGDRDQRIVEAAELATGLWLGRDRLVPALGADGLAQVLAWLALVHGRDVYDDNWVLFPAIVATIQRGFGMTVVDAAIDGGLDRMLERYAGDGWYADGPGRPFDQYSGWAVHWHLLLWSRIDGDRRPRIRRLIEARMRTWLETVPLLTAADGSRPLFGRSLGYRFASAAPLGLAALLGLDAPAPGLARRVASGTIAHHLDQGALDPATGWLRRGIAGERPDVCERYVSRGAVAWAAHALVALGLPDSAPFWRAREEPLPVERGTGRRALRDAGFLIGWRRATGETWMANGLSGHEADIPGHDYTPYYGKLVYRSHFPFTVRTASGEPGPDGAVLFEGARGATHRGLTERGGAGPGWTWSDYRVRVGDRRHAATTVLIPWGDVEVRVTGVRPDGPLRLLEAPAALGSDEGVAIERQRSDDGRWAAATANGRTVSVRALAGYARVEESRPFSTAGPDRNLVADHAEQPVAWEGRASAAPRIVATIGCAVATGDAGRRRMEAVRGTRAPSVGRWAFEIRLGRSEVATVWAGPRPPRRLSVAGCRADGPALRVVRARRDGSAFEGEAIASIEGVARFDRPGAVSVRRLPHGQGVEVVTAEGFTIDEGWSGGALTALDVRVAGRWCAIGSIAQPNRVPVPVIRSLQRSGGHRLVELRLRP